MSDDTQPSPGLFDITGHIEAAIDDWFRDLVTDALNPVLDLLGHTLLATPNVTAQSRVGQLWLMSEGIADAFLVLFVLVGGAIVMGHETLQTRTALKDVLPRIVVAAVTANASLSLAGLVISMADSLSQAILGQGVDPSQAAVVLRQLVLGSLADRRHLHRALGRGRRRAGRRSCWPPTSVASPSSSCWSSPRRSA